MMNVVPTAGAANRIPEAPAAKSAGSNAEAPSDDPPPSLPGVLAAVAN
jgi:hypothetical protein